MTALEMALRIHDNSYTDAPYRFGNLRNNGIGAVSAMTEAQAEFRFNEFDAAPYGIILNEVPVINYFGKYSHNNKHYQWLDNSIANTVAQIISQLGE